MAQAAEAAGVSSFEDVRRHPRRIAGFTAEAQETVRQLKQFLFHSVYFSPALVEERRRSSAMIGEMFQFLLDHPEAMPEEYREFTADEEPHRAVCDYIAGMTDGFFERSYAALFGATPDR